MGKIVSAKFRLYRRSNGVFYAEATDNPRPRRRGAPALRAQRGRAGRAGNPRGGHGLPRLADPFATTRTWRWVADQIIAARSGETAVRWERAARDAALKPVMPRIVLDTRAEDFLAALNCGTVSTNVYLRRLHNFALDMGWLARPVIVRRQWPRVKHKKRRDITAQEHARILAAEGNAERRDFYELLWQLGASQGDAARLQADDIDWSRREIRFFRAKTGSVVCQRFGSLTEAILCRRPPHGPLFPYLAAVRSADRATEFGQRCRQLAIQGVSLHSYRYSWARRAKRSGYPERYAQLALGHNSRAIHEHYAGVDAAEIPCLEDYETAAGKIVPLPAAAAPRSPGLSAG